MNVIIKNTAGRFGQKCDINVNRFMYLVNNSRAFSPLLVFIDMFHALAGMIVKPVLNCMTKMSLKV